MLSRLAMGKRFDSNIISLIIIGCFISAVFSANDSTTLLVNCFVLFIMYAFLRKGIGSRRTQSPGLYSLRSMIRDLEKASEQLRELDEPNPERIREILTAEEDTYESNVFKATMKEYFDESDALVRRGKAYYSCNIADYVNEDLLNKVGNTAFNDFLSGVMTGLGILGTFVGLAIGLQSFRTDSAAAMTDSIAPLIEGIKVAFYTSIFGVLLSLVYGTLYKHRFNRAEAAVEEFVTLFYRYSGYRPENEAFSRLLQFQEEQTDSMNQFAEEISIALADAIRDTLAPTLTALPEQMAEMMANNIVPTMEKLQTSVRDLTEELPKQIAQTITSNITPTMQAVSKELKTLTEEMSETFAEAQQNGVIDMVDHFFDEMDRAIGGQMENLEQSIKTICEWQETTSKRLGEVVESVCQNAESVSVINDDLKEVVTQLVTFIASMDTAAEKLLKTSANVDQFAEKTATAVDGYKDILEGVADISQQIHEHQKDVSELAAKQSEQMRTDAEFVQKQTRANAEFIQEQTRANAEFIQKQSTQLAETCDGIAADFSEAAEQLATVSGQLSNDIGDAMTRTYAQFDSQLATAITHFSGTLAELRELVEKTPKIIDALSASMKTMKTDVTDTLGAVQKGQKESAAAVQKSTEELTKHIQNLDAVLKSAIVTLEKQEETIVAQANAQADAQEETIRKLHRVLDSLQEKTIAKHEESAAEKDA